MESTNKCQCLKLKINSDFFAKIAAVMYFSGSAVCFALNNSIGRIGFSFLVDTLYVIFLFGSVLFCVILSRERKWQFGIFLGIFVLVVLYFGLTLVVHPSYLEYYLRDTVGVWDELFSPVTGCIYGLMVVLLFRKADCLWRCLKFSGWINLIFYSFVILIRDGNWTGYNAAGQVIATSYDLGIGYNVIFITCILLCSYLEKRRIVDLIAMVYSLFLVLGNGSRGALICFLLCVVLLVASKSKKKWTWKQKLGILVMFLLIIIAVNDFNAITIMIGRGLNRLGIQSRTITFMLTGTLTDDNGRNQITMYAVEAIMAGGIIGLGAFGDRPFIAPHFWWGYSHNIILEMVCDFGIIIGSILLLLLAIKLRRIWLAPKGNAYRYIFIALLSACGKLIISDTFWGYPQFWALLGMLIMYQRFENKSDN